MGGEEGGGGGGRSYHEYSKSRFLLATTFFNFFNGNTFSHPPFHPSGINNFIINMTQAALQHSSAAHLTIPTSNPCFCETTSHLFEGGFLCEEVEVFDKHCRPWLPFSLAARLNPRILLVDRSRSSENQSQQSGMEPDCQRTNYNGSGMEPDCQRTNHNGSGMEPDC